MAKKLNKTKNQAVKAVEANKKPLIIAAVGAGVVALGAGLIGAFKSMKKNAKAQREVDKAELDAVKAESKANFEENRGSNTYVKAKAQGKKSWDDAHMSPSERAAEDQKKRDEQLAEANKRKAEADARYEAAKVNK